MNTEIFTLLSTIRTHLPSPHFWLFLFIAIHAFRHLRNQGDSHRLDSYFGEVTVSYREWRQTNLPKILDLWHIDWNVIQTIWSLSNDTNRFQLKSLWCKIEHNKDMSRISPKNHQPNIKLFHLSRMFCIESTGLRMRQSRNCVCMPQTKRHFHSWSFNIESSGNFSKPCFSLLQRMHTKSIATSSPPQLNVFAVATWAWHCLLARNRWKWKETWISPFCVSVKLVLMG